jgi:hypothetical protein
LGIVAVAVLLRAFTAYGSRNIANPDEAFQYVEQAYRLLTGKGQVPWEFVVGVRSWLLPLLAVPPLALGRALSPSPDVWWGCITAMMIALSAVTVVGAYVIGRRIGTRSHGLWAAFVSAMWCESVFYSAHFLADSLGAVLLVATLAVSLTGRTPRRALILGVLLGAAFLVRMQLGPALAVVALAYVWRAPRTLVAPIAVGALVSLALSGLLDWATWGAPFKSLWGYFQVNRQGVADSFGTDPPTWYLTQLGVNWSWFAIAIVPAMLLGAARAPLMFAVAIAILATLSVIPHKEYRFIYPAIEVILILCAIGTADLAARLGQAGSRTLTVSCALGGAWIVLSLVVAAAPQTRTLWLKESGTWRAISAIDNDPSSCGVAVWPQSQWPFAPRSRLRDDLPLFRVRDSDPKAFNYVLDFGPAPPALGPAFREVAYYPVDSLRLWRRNGTCIPALGAPLVPSPQDKTAAVLQKLGRRP